MASTHHRPIRLVYKSHRNQAASNMRSLQFPLTATALKFNLLFAIYIATHLQHCRAAWYHEPIRPTEQRTERELWTTQPFHSCWFPSRVKNSKLNRQLADTLPFPIWLCQDHECLRVKIFMFTCSCYINFSLPSDLWISSIKRLKYSDEADENA